MRDISECDEWPDPLPLHGSYWLDRDGKLCQVQFVSHERREVEIMCVVDEELYLEWSHMFSSLYEPVSDEDLPLHLLAQY